MVRFETPDYPEFDVSLSSPNCIDMFSSRNVLDLLHKLVVVPIAESIWTFLVQESFTYLWLCVRLSLILSDTVT